jgi:ABC-type polysaccharide/polyol phosphate export permease
MKWNNTIRQSHRWVSILFTLVVILVMILAAGQQPPPEWVFFLPLLPLALLVLTGLYLFALPYVAKRRGGSHADSGGSL